jgi:SAM-dependent methyltransferase
MTQTTFEQGLDSVAELVKRFGRNAATYRSPEYNETRARIEFINPFFEALDWDVRNREGVAPQFQEVLHEFSAEVEGTRKAPDYAFRTGRKDPQFYVEAKKPGVNVKTNADAAYQLRRYAWSARLPLSLLTDFEELAVYDCRSRPSNADKASAGRVHLYTYESYPDHFRDIWNVFSRQAVREGSFDRFVKSEKGKGELIDAEFLKEIQGWRDVLARNMAVRNEWLAPDDLNDAVQRTIDRIIFMRMAEDRGIETYEQLRRLATPTPTLPLAGGGQGGGIYAELIDLCRRADDKYNSGLFDFHADTLTPRLAVDDRVLKPILADLYFPHSPYEFSVLPIRVLGNIYEQFLGQVIRLTAGHQAKVEEKPEVRKAGGVYYTPEYIVDYIVKNTVGKLVEGQSPKQLASFRVLDAACGSGSFLLGAYQFLLDYYLGWYVEHNPNKYPNAAWRRGEEWRLTIAEKKRILTTHIFGVDIDRQAVEVTKLSLLLKVLEGESTETLQMALPGFQERALPNLDNNIKCGNSLIGPDYFTGQLLPNADELRRVNPFDWVAEFPEAMQKGGFDAVIGNPPYITYALGRGRLKHADAEIDYIAQHYASSSEYKINSFAVFYERALALCSTGGMCAYIVPGTILINQALGKIRYHLLKNATVWRVVSLYYKVFAGAEMGDCAILFVTKRKSAKHSVELMRYNSEGWDTRWTKDEVASDSILAMPDARIYMNAVDYKILSLANNASLQPLGKVAKFYNGIKTGNNKKYLSDKRSSPKYVPVLRGRDFKRYGPAKPSIFVYFDSRALWSNTDETKLGVPEKIVIRQTGDTLTATLDKRGVFCMDTVHMIYESPFDKRFLLGLLNSRFLNFYHGCLVPEFGKAFAEVKIANLEKLPVPRIQLSNSADMARHDRMVSLVEQMLELHKRLAAASSSDRELYQRQIDATDREVDKLVYELYSLTPDEIAIVEGQR